MSIWPVVDMSAALQVGGLDTTGNESIDSQFYDLQQTILEKEET